jgi:ATP-dependent DNA ligase
VRIEPIIPVVRREPFDDPGWLFELKWDGFRGVADTVNGQILSKNKNHFRKFDRLLRMLPPGCVFDGEIVALDEGGRPVFNDLMFGRREPSYVAFDILFENGRDVREEPLVRRKALLKEILGDDVLQSDHVVGESECLLRPYASLISRDHCEADERSVRKRNTVVQNPKLQLLAEGGAKRTVRTGIG